MLWWLLAINAVMFGVELAAGILGESTGLIADSMDMLADAAVYGMGLYAIGRHAAVKAHAARVAGVVEVGMAAAVIVEVVRRVLVGSEPDSGIMMAVGGLALTANVTCVILLAKHRRGEIHMRASWIFSRNDVIVNLGIIAGGALVAVTGSRLPDLVLGLAVALVVLRGGIGILRDANTELVHAGSPGD